MARPLRLEFEGALYHVMSRGDGREDIYLSDVDRLRFLEILGEVWERFDWTIHAHCQMTNHYHLGRPKPQQPHDRKMNLMKMVRVSIAPTCLDHQTLNNSYLLLPINRLQTEMETCRTSKSTMKPAEPEGIQSRRCGHSRFTVIFVTY